MTDVLPFLIVGLVSGSLYGLAGLGLVLTYRTSGVLNLAHGSIAAGAAFLFYTLNVENGWAWPLAALVTVVGYGLVVGLLLERLTRTMAAAAPALVVVLTVGLILAIQGLLFIRYGDTTRFFPPFLPTSGFDVGGVTIGWDQVVTASVALLGAAGLYAFLQSTRLGTAMRGVVDSPSLVALTGESPQRVATIAWIIGTSFAAMSGILLAPTIGLDPTLLTLLVVQSFGAAAIGAFKSLPLTYIGGLVVGVAASLATKYLTIPPWSGLPPAVPFVILIVVLLVFSDRLPRTRASLQSLVAQPVRHDTRVRAPLVVGTGVVLVAIPFVVGSFLPVWTGAASYVLIFGSLSLLVWTSGQVSLCQLAFAAVGATSLSHFLDFGLPWLVALILAGLTVVPIGGFLALSAVRTSGIYLALLTLGFGILMQNVVFQSDLMFGAQTHVQATRPVLGPIDGTSDRWLYAICVAIAAVAILSLRVIQRGQLGRLLRAMAESPTMLSTNGLDVGTTKLIVFCISSFLAAIGGGLMVTQFGSVAGQTFGSIQSLVLIAVLGMCGTNLLRSPILAALLIAVIPGYVDGFDANRQLLLFGLAAVVAALLLANREALHGWINRAATSSADRRLHGPIGARNRVPATATAARRIPT